MSADVVAVLMTLLVLGAHGAGSEKEEYVVSKQSPVYVAGRATANSCGNDALIIEGSECKAAATALGKLPYHESGAWENEPRGCLVDVRGTFHNTHATGERSGTCRSLGMMPICVRRSHHAAGQGESGDNTETETAAHDIAGAGASAHLEALREACGQLCNTTVAVRRFFCDFDASEVNACIQDLVLEHSGWEPLRKQTNCHGLMTSPRVVAARHAALPAPARIPDVMLPSFSYDGQVEIQYGAGFWLWPNVKGQNMPLWPASLVDEWIADCRRGWIHGSYGYAESRLAYQALQQMALGGKHIVVFGSERPWLEACVLAAGASKVTTIEYSNVTTDHPAIQVITPQEAARRWVHGTLPSFDAVATFSSLEHAGLGRYGDELNPWGDIMAVGQAWCISKPGALMMIGMPVSGKDRVEWNGGREYGPVMFPHLVANWLQVWRSAGPPHGQRGHQVVQVFQRID